MDLIYLDHNATTPVLPEVVEAMRPYWHENFANPASAHQFGRRARQGLESARERVAEMLGADPGEAVFTSGGTEANNLALFSLAGDQPGTLSASPIEHPSVAEPVARLARCNWDVRYLSVNSSGVVEPQTLADQLRLSPRLVTVMLVNNETGAIQPIQELLALCRQAALPPLFHCDAVQAVGKMPVNFHQLGVDTLSLSAHKFHGPRGIGVLLVRMGTCLQPTLLGGHQQRGIRPGTEPVALAVGLAKALELAHAQLDERRTKVEVLRDRFLERLRAEANPVVVNGSLTGLPYTLNVSFPGCRAETLLMQLDLAGVACSTGSACSSGSLLPSPVLRAMGCPPDVLHSALRFSFSHLLNQAHVLEAADRIARAVQHCRKHSEI